MAVPAGTFVHENPWFPSYHHASPHAPVPFLRVSFAPLPVTSVAVSAGFRVLKVFEASAGLPLVGTLQTEFSHAL